MLPVKKRRGRPPKSKNIANSSVAVNNANENIIENTSNNPVANDMLNLVATAVDKASKSTKRPKRSNSKKSIDQYFRTTPSFDILGNDEATSIPVSQSASNIPGVDTTHEIVTDDNENDEDFVIIEDYVDDDKDYIANEEEDVAMELEDNNDDTDYTNELGDDANYDDNDIQTEKKPKRKNASTKEKSTSAKRPYKKRTKKEIAPTPIPISTPDSTLEKKGRIIRALKDLSSARDKIERMYGLNRDKLLNLAKIKEGFETSLFDFPSSNIQKDSRFYVECIPPCAQEDITNVLINDDTKKTQYHEITDEIYRDLFHSRVEPVSVEIGDVSYDLQTDDLAQFPIFPIEPRTGFLYNIGGMVTDMVWLHQKIDNEQQYLAVSTSQYFDKPLDNHLRMFHGQSHVSTISIFRLNIKTLEFIKLYTVINPYGEAWNLKWHEGYNNPSNLGLLGFVCQDGSVKFLEIPNITDSMNTSNNNGNKNGKIIFCESPSISMSLPNTLITCFDFLSPTTIICGFKNGYIAEYDLRDPQIPSYYKQIHDSYIINIVAAYSEFEPLVVSTVSVDGYLYLFDPRSIFTTKTTVTRFRGSNTIPITYIPQLYTLLHSDGANSLKSVPPRTVFAVHPVSLMESTITSISGSRLHPLSLTSTADGMLIIDNITRRYLTTIKNTSSTHKSLRLWKWDYSSKQNKYRLDFNYTKYQLNVNDVSKIHLDPQGINICCVKWNETNIAGKFYAFANSAGILTVERLGEE
ncbi:hypothetical protein TBLA_0A06550 [Henningerozyma blattae CBS 6284]|uniref:Uncharacterized protein n=1 Tax=Henningerozyma blattae (strain ATCC 34711 / CBS 6284 / DSM 70876 / NBRC 10599 / NRRL Y-10934 / UCD 77-7) TaxID=1071380 RepID=I2GWE5_HENB6|nr:hypothetical protein TBLA_0A06550 [Tetrapisispora blattae CBS 6284]CCH58447.1 hypothetical protein TBLA_0A06550 [Tetrapisispora blattae CBS 6284]